MFRQWRVECRGEKALTCSRVRYLCELTLTLSVGVASDAFDQRSVRFIKSRPSVGRGRDDGQRRKFRDSMMIHTTLLNPLAVIRCRCLHAECCTDICRLTGKCQRDAIYLNRVLRKPETGIPKMAYTIVFGYNAVSRSALR